MLVLQATAIAMFAASAPAATNTNPSQVMQSRQLQYDSPTKPSDTYSLPHYHSGVTHHIIRHHVISHPYTTYHKVASHHTVTHPYTTYHKVATHHVVSHPYTTYHKVEHHHTVSTPYTTYSKVASHHTVTHPYTTYHKVATHHTEYHPYTTYHKVYTHHKVTHPYTTYTRIPHHHTVKHPYTTYKNILKHKTVATPYTTYHKEPVYHTASKTIEVPNTIKVPKTTYETKYSKKFSYHKCDKFQRLRYVPKLVDGNALALSMPTPAPYVAPKIIVQHHYTTNTVHHYHTNDVHHYHTIMQTYSPTYKPTYRPTYRPTYQPTYPAPAPYEAPEAHSGYRSLRAQGAYDNDDDNSVGSRVEATASAYQPALTLNNAEEHTIHHFVAAANFEARVAAQAPVCPAALVTYRGKSETKQTTCHKEIPHLVKHTIQVPKTIMRPKTVTHTVTSYKEVAEHHKKYKKVPYHVKVPQHHVATHDVVTYTEVPHQHYVTHLVTDSKEVPEKHVATHDVVSYKEVPEKHIATHDVVTYSEVPHTHVTTKDVVSYQDVPEQHYATHDVVSYHDVPEQHYATHDVVSYHTVPEHHIAHQVVTEVTTQHVQYHVSPVYHSTYVGDQSYSSPSDTAAASDTAATESYSSPSDTAAASDTAATESYSSPSDTAAASDTAATESYSSPSDTAAASDTDYASRRLQYSTQRNVQVPPKVVSAKVPLSTANFQTPQSANFGASSAAYEGGLAASGSYDDLGLRVVPQSKAVPLANAGYGAAVQAASAGYGGGVRAASGGYNAFASQSVPVTTLSQWPAHMNWYKTGNFLADQEAEFAVVKHLICHPTISIAYKCPHCPSYVKQGGGAYDRRLETSGETETVSDESYTVSDNQLAWEADQVATADFKTVIFHHVYHKGEKPTDMSKYGDWQPAQALVADGNLSTNTHTKVGPIIASASALVVALVAAVAAIYRYKGYTVRTTDVATVPTLSVL